MTKDLQGSSHHLKVVGGAYGKRKDFIYEYADHRSQRNRKTDGNPWNAPAVWKPSAPNSSIIVHHLANENGSKHHR